MYATELRTGGGKYRIKISISRRALILLSILLVLAAGRPAIAGMFSGEAGDLMVSSLLQPPIDIGAVPACENGIPVVIVNWTPSPSATVDGYEVLRSDGTGFRRVAVMEGPDMQGFIDLKGGSGRLLSYKVRAYGGSVRSQPTPETSASAPFSC